MSAGHPSMSRRARCPPRLPSCVGAVLTCCLPWQVCPHPCLSSWVLGKRLPLWYADSQTNWGTVQHPLPSLPSSLMGPWPDRARTEVLRGGLPRLPWRVCQVGLEALRELSGSPWLPGLGHDGQAPCCKAWHRGPQFFLQTGPQASWEELVALSEKTSLFLRLFSLMEYKTSLQPAATFEAPPRPQSMQGVT